MSEESKAISALAVAIENVGQKLAEAIGDLATSTLRISHGTVNGATGLEMLAGPLLAKVPVGLVSHSSLPRPLPSASPRIPSGSRSDRLTYRSLRRLTTWARRSAPRLKS
jgi:hypothetical protein